MYIYIYMYMYVYIYIYIIYYIYIYIYIYIGAPGFVCRRSRLLSTKLTISDEHVHVITS